ncbi:immunoglobulin-like domain-containing protein [Thermococcus thermotolerans]|uniref:immunoglobulin-like domain-containing protein n=1 Tax=Thermococcus thermotolerans TaxID=2969672 RepID=UPI0021584183|nr:immunoglobulin-like domain-containing protein [Thermococcus thermotolerans]
MRKIVPVLLILLLVPAGYYMTLSDEESTGKQNLQNDNGVSLELDKVTYSPGDTMVITLINNASTNATASYHFKLYKLEGKAWKEVPVNLMFIEIAVVIEPGKSWEQKVDLSRLNLEPGHYKIVKEVYLEGTTVKAEAEFDIRE